MSKNCVFIVPGWSQREAHCIRYSYGIDFESRESEARFHRTLYPIRHDAGSFACTLQFSTYREFEDMGLWFVAYGRKISGNEVPVAMRVQIPVRGIDKSVVPVRGISFGRKFDDITWRLALGFIEVEDVLAYDSPLLSRFVQATNQTDVSQFFYPAGNQLDASDREAAKIRDEVLKQFPTGGGRSVM
jgi:hypothetical protein